VFGIILQETFKANLWRGAAAIPVGRPGIFMAASHAEHLPKPLQNGASERSNYNSSNPILKIGQMVKIAPTSHIQHVNCHLQHKGIPICNVWSSHTRYLGIPQTLVCEEFPIQERSTNKDFVKI
jgi:hypothetical protein